MCIGVSATRQKHHPLIFAKLPLKFANFLSSPALFRQFPFYILVFRESPKNQIFLWTPIIDILSSHPPPPPYFENLVGGSISPPTPITRKGMQTWLYCKVQEILLMKEYYSLRGFGKEAFSLWCSSCENCFFSLQKSPKTFL